MTHSEFHLAFNIQLDKEDIVGYPSFLPEEVDFWLNKAIIKFIKTRYSGLNSHNSGFQQSEKRDNDLRGAIREYNEPFIAEETSIDIVRPNDFWFGVGEDITVASHDLRWPYTLVPGGNPDVITDRIPIPKVVDTLECTIENFTSRKENPLSEHRLHRNTCKPLRLSELNVIHLETDGNYYFTNYRMTYIGSPELINYRNATTDYTYIPEHAHDEIVSIAVALALENVSEPRFQTQEALNQVME